MHEHTSDVSRRMFLGSAAILGVSALTIPFTTTKAHAVTAAEKQAEAEAVLETLNGLHERVDIASANYYTALDEKTQAEDKMNEAQGRINEANLEISKLQEKLGTRARSMYRNGSFTFLDMLLGATSFTAFASNWDLLNDMNNDDAAMVQQTKDLRSEIETQKAEYNNQAQVASQKADDAAQAQAEAEALVAETQNIYDNLSAEVAQLLAEEEAAREAEAQRQAEEAVRRAAEEAARQAAEEEAVQSSDESSGDQESEDSSSNNNSSSRSDSTSSNSSSSDDEEEEDEEESSSSKSSSSGDSKTQSVTGNTVVDRAYSQLGKPYAWGAAGPSSFDCSGFVSYCLTGEYGNRVGTTYTFMDLPRVSNPQPGDICTTSSHCGIYIGDGQMIHAPHTGDVVKVAAVQSGMIYVRY